MNHHETDMICKGKEEVRERKERASSGDRMFRRSLASDLVGLTITPPPRCFESS
jgi:hypothetical protein